MTRYDAGVLITVNGGSSSVKLAAYTCGEQRQLVMRAHIEGIGKAEPLMTVSHADNRPPDTCTVQVMDHASAASALVKWLDHSGFDPIVAVGHRVVHGGMHLLDHEVITPNLVAELRRVQYLDLAHLPLEIALVQAFTERFPGVPQVACFDTAFHRDLPRTAQLLPIPRRYLDTGVRRFGFHGLSYTYLMQALEQAGGQESANGRVILAHLGSGASMAAVHEGRPVDTTMGFTPAAGVVMATRPGDLDPGLLVYLMRTEGLSPEQMDDFIARQCGLAGVSGGFSDLRELMKRRETDRHAAEAVALFCYSARKWIGAYMAVLGGLDTLVFSGGIGENSAPVRAAICGGLAAFGLELDERRNAASAPIISADSSRVTVRVIPTDEEAVMAKIVFDMTVKGSKGS